MAFNQDIDFSIYTIRSYQRGEIIVSLPPRQEEMDEARNASPNAKPRLPYERLSQSFIITAETVIRDWPPQDISTLSRDHIAQLAAYDPEVVLIGTGTRLTWPDRALLTPLMEQHIGFEVMDTAAACRTYNVLSLEGRKVVAGLMMIR
ncbi:MAG: Mth938-like domain-containing protein [Gammaproteobacteria bacterium]|nr:Mth938-like domain-containing protein [Gammaproteobacteria bacterium]